MAGAKAGIDQRRQRRSAVVAGVGDGVVAVALPLLAANLTHDPLAIAAVVAAQHLPWVLVHLVWRFLRVDRRTMVGTVDTVRALALGMLGLLSLIGRETILDIQLVALVVGLGEALTDGSETETSDVSGLSARGMVGIGLVGLPLGGVLYEIYPATPFLFEVVAFAVAAVFALLVRADPTHTPVADADDESSATVSPWATVPGTGAVTASAAGAALATSAVLGVLALFALEDLGLGAPAFGGLLAGLALSAAVGGWAAPEVGRILGVKPGIVVAAVVAAAGSATASQVADPGRPLVGAAALGVAAGAGMVVAVLHRALLQRNAACPLRGAVLQRFHLVVWTAIPVGALLGGWVASRRSVHEVLLWSTIGWAVAALAAVLARPTEKSPEFV